MTRGYRGIALLVPILCAIVGCSKGDLPDLAPVSGVVTLDGKPLANKEVVFAPDKGRPSIGITDENGAYELKYTPDVKGAIIGHHTVTVSTPRPDDGNMKGYKETVPMKYFKNSELKADVTSGRNKKDFELKSN